MLSAGPLMQFEVFQIIDGIMYNFVNRKLCRNKNWKLDDSGAISKDYIHTLSVCPDVCPKRQLAGYAFFRLQLFMIKGDLKGPAHSKN